MNKRLFSGLDLTNQIVGILVKFRKDYVAIMPGIEVMCLPSVCGKSTQKFT